MWGPDHWASVCYLANYSVVLRKPEAVCEARALVLKLTKWLASMQLSTPSSQNPSTHMETRGAMSQGTQAP